MSPKVSVVVHCGTQAIGGSCVELRCGDTRIVIDVGMPLVNPDGSEFNSRECQGVEGQKLYERQILPQVEGLYHWQPRSVDAILVSHAHMDHYGFLDHVHGDIPVYLSEETLKLMRLTKQYIKSTPVAKRPVVFKWHESFQCGPFKITPHLVDHSACGAYAFLVEAEGKRVLYSGDLRDHGGKWKTFPLLIKNVPKGIDAVLLEGTMMGRNGVVKREEQLCEEAVEFCRETRGPVLSCQSGQNIDRLCAYFKAARHANRLFLVDPYVAHVLDTLYDPKRIVIPTVSRNPGTMRVFYPNWMKQSDIALRYGRYKIEAEEIAAKRERVFMIVRPTMRRFLNKVQRVGNGLDGGLLLFSMWSGYKEEKGPKEFLEWAREKQLDIHDHHTSGHATIEALQRLVAAIEPKRTIPIHTFHGDDYRKYFGPAVCRLRDGEALEL